MDYQTSPKVSLCHMGCQVGEGTGGVEEVTFLYRLTPGACPKSYGVNVARLAGLPDDVLQRAVIKSQEFEGLYDVWFTVQSGFVKVYNNGVGGNSGGRSNAKT